MKAIIRAKSGKKLTNLEVQEIATPICQADEVKIKMASSRINPVDIQLMDGMPFLKYKKPQIAGIDGAGEVIEVGKAVSNFELGDKVFFYRKFTDIGTWAKEITIKAAYIAKIPNQVNVQDAGSFALPLLTGFEMITSLNPQQGETILIHGAAGGVGFQAVQVAKAKGLTIIATASEKQFDILKKAGVTQLINYKSQQFETVFANQKVDYIVDTVGGEVLLKSIGLKPKKVVSVHYTDPSKLHKTGINMPGILKWLLKLSTRKFDKLARKNEVTLIGQVAGANGQLLQQASDTLNQIDYITNTYKTLAFREIEKTGLTADALGKVIVFNQ